MISPLQARELRKLIKLLAKSEVDASWAGAQPPDEAETLRAELRAAKAELELFIRTITGGKEQAPVHVPATEAPRIVSQPFIPPNPDGQNDDRAEWAGAALRHFQTITGTDFEDALYDLLNDLMHWADRNGMVFETELQRARDSYAEETYSPNTTGPRQ